VQNFKFASLAILEVLAFNAQKIKGHVTLTPPTSREFFFRVMSGLYIYLGLCVPNFKFATLAFLKLLAFNAQKIKDHAPFSRFFFRGHVGTLSGFTHHQNRLKIATVKTCARTHKSVSYIHAVNRIMRC